MSYEDVHKKRKCVLLGVKAPHELSWHRPRLSLPLRAILESVALTCLDEAVHFISQPPTIAVL